MLRAVFASVGGTLIPLAAVRRTDCLWQAQLLKFCCRMSSHRRRAPTTCDASRTYRSGAGTTQTVSGRRRLRSILTPGPIVDETVIFLK